MVLAPIIIFDLGGVLVNLDWDKACTPLTDLSDRSSDFVMSEIENGPIVESSMLGRLTTHEFHQAICDKLHVNIEYHQFIELWNSILDLDYEVACYVEELANSHTLILASNTDGIHFPHCMDNFDVLKVFDQCFLSHAMGLLKPDPAYFHQVLYELWASPANCIFIDDRIGNVRSAQSLGIKGLVFESLDKLKSDLSSLI